MMMEIIRDDYGFPYLKIKDKRVIFCTKCQKPLSAKVSGFLCALCLRKSD